ncbi:hypothetical protein BU17DRAFT_82904 [Hysterangium stoloniferum]|nr:hypothetical protein BU17DRAFT_82904 [Hysterangium stoloniferum]
MFNVPSLITLVALLIGSITDDVSLLSHPPNLAKLKLFPSNIQAILGHGFFGAYYQRLLPDLPTSCPCGTEDIQSRLHILSECPLHEEHRHTLRTASQDLSLPIILGTNKGLEALVEFTAASDAFRKA